LREAIAFIAPTACCNSKFRERRDAIYKKFTLMLGERIKWERLRFNDFYDIGARCRLLASYGSLETFTRFTGETCRVIWSSDQFDLLAVDSAGPNRKLGFIQEGSPVDVYCPD
jgi:hypothetical protein